MSEAIAYRLSFLPSDPNIAPEECLPIYYYATLADAQIAAAKDARDTAAMHANAGERAEWAAYAQTSAHALQDALSESPNHDAFPVQVRHGDNPRRIGTYYIHRVREGDQADCMGCGDFRGIVTAIHSNGDTFSVCEACEREQEQFETCADH